MRIRPIVAILAVALLGGCRDEPATFVPGTEMTFPVYADAVIDDLGQQSVTRCRTNPDPTAPDCALKRKERLDNCRAQEPRVFKSDAEFQRYAKTYTACVEKP